jgi:MFS family permease
MCEKNTKSTCQHCPPEGAYVEAANSADRAELINVPLISNLLLILMPKCSFCLLAYTSSVMLCTRNETLVATSTHSSPLTIALTTSFCLFILVGILLNRRGRRTWYALALALSGIACMLISVVLGGGEWLYYTGSVLVFLGIWVNGSFRYVWNQMVQLARGPGSGSSEQLFRTR